MESVVWMRKRKTSRKIERLFSLLRTMAAAEDYITPHRIKMRAIVPVKNGVAFA